MSYAEQESESPRMVSELERLKRENKMMLYAILKIRRLQDNHHVQDARVIAIEVLSEFASVENELVSVDTSAKKTLTCQTCGGPGEVSFQLSDGSFQNEECPDCVTAIKKQVIDKVLQFLRDRQGPIKYSGAANAIEFNKERILK